MKEVRVDGKMIPLSLSFETMKPIKTFFFFLHSQKGRQSLTCDLNYIKVL